MQKNDKKIYYITAILAAVAILFLAVNQYFKTQNVHDAMIANKMLVDNIWVYKSEAIINNETKLRAKSYKISYDDLNISKHCKGFFIIQKDGSIIKDVDCK